MAIIVKLEQTAGVELTDKEKALKNAIQNSGAEQLKGDEISDSLGNKLLEHGSNAASHHQEWW